VQAGIQQQVRRAGVFTVDEVLADQARRTPSRIALDDGTTTLTHAALDERACRLADTLAGLGVIRGTRVARFVDRAKYLIKSGGENIYPIEIERVLMSDARVAEAVVVRRRDATWGEVPVAFVALHAPGPTADELMRVCREGLSSYKLPREIRFVASQDDFPRSTSGKVQRQRVERWLEQGNE
jgi:acyl-CoA synthetase (AMP-forming)/AMP-acid ligase II